MRRITRGAMALAAVVPVLMGMTDEVVTARGLSHRAVVQGTVSSGGGSNATAIAGAGVTIYQAQDGGAQTLGTGTSDPSGHFSVTVTVHGGGGILYAVASKGGSVELKTLIGTTIPASITINEMTTVAAAYTLARLPQNGDTRGNPLPFQVAAGMAENLVSAAAGMPSTVMQTSPNADQTNAWRSLGTLANILAACVRNSPNACSDLFALTVAPNGATPTTTLQAIINIARNPAANVKPLFALGEALKVFDPSLEARHGPDATDEFLRLDAFTLAIKFNATGRVDGNGNELCPFGGLGNFVFDEKGYAWITNNVVQGTTGSTNCQVVLKPNGQPADGANNTPNSPLFGGGLLGQGFGIGFDPSGNLWSGNFGWGGVNPTDPSGNPGGSVSKFTGSGVALSPPTGFTSSLYQAQGTVSDRLGNIWIASYGNSRVQVFPLGNPDSAFPFYQDANTSPFDLRLDNDGAAWVSYTDSSTLSKLTLTGTKLEHQLTVPIGTANRPKGITVDSKGNVWAASGEDDSVYAFDTAGNPLGVFKGGAVKGPWGVSADADDIVWVANFGALNNQDNNLKYRVSALCGATVSKCPAGLKLGDPITNNAGYTLPSGGDEVLLHNGKPLYFPNPLKSYQPLIRLTAAHPDMAGNLWVMNNWKPNFTIDLLENPGGDAVIVFVGLAAPVKPVLYNAPATSPFPASPADRHP